MRRFVVIVPAFFLPLFMLAPAQACQHRSAYPCHERNDLGRLGAAILGGFASNPPIPGSTWGLSPQGRIVPVPIDTGCAGYRRWRCWD